MYCCGGRPVYIDKTCEEVTSDSLGTVRFAVPAQGNQVYKLEIFVSVQLFQRISVSNFSTPHYLFHQPSRLLIHIGTVVTSARRPNSQSDKGSVM